VGPQKFEKLKNEKKKFEKSLTHQTTLISFDVIDFVPSKDLPKSIHARAKTIIAFNKMVQLFTRFEIFFCIFLKSIFDSANMQMSKSQEKSLSQLDNQKTNMTKHKNEKKNSIQNLQSNN
jgi:GTPase involved in cell partitioning and DNA repair